MLETNAYRIEAEPTSYGQRIQLPNRELGEASVWGWVAVAFGGIGVLFMLSWIGGPAAIGIRMVLAGNWFGFLIFGFGMLGMGGLFVTTKILAAGIAILRNRVGCEVRITDRQLISREKFGWFSHTTKVDRKTVESLFLRPLLASDLEPKGDASVSQIEWLTKRLPEDWHAIATSRRKGSLIAAGYPCEILLPLANVIKDELDRNRVGLVSIVEPNGQTESVSASETIQQPVSIVRQSTEDVEAASVELPADSMLEISEGEGATIYRIPAQGVFKGSRGLMLFAIVWNSILILITTAMLFGKAEVEGELWIMLLFLAVFWAVGIGLVVGSFYLGRMSALIGVREGLLFIERKTIFGDKWMEFEPGRVASIHIGAGNMEVNDQPVMELKIQPVGKPAVGMFSQLDDDEIRWLAAQLSNQLELRPESSNSWQRYLDPANPLVAPDSSQVVVDRLADQTLITIPRRNLEGRWGLLLMGFVFAFGGIPGAIVGLLYLEASWFVVLVGLIFALFGIATLIVERMYSSRWFRLNANGALITIERHGFLGEKTVTIAKEDVRAITLKDSGTKVNARTYMHLAIKSRKASETFTLMSGHEEREIAYVAALIDDALGLSENSPATYR